MELKDQVVNRELSQKIESLGVKQESLWYWYPHIKGYSLCSKEDFIHRSWNYNKEKPVCSAFTVAELGEMLPKFTEWKNKNDYEISVVIGKSKEQYISKATMMDDHKESADTEANARAKMLIYLLENKNRRR